MKTIFSDTVDERLQKGSIHADVTLKNMRLFSQQRFPMVKSGTWAWHRIIPVCRSISVWRLMHGRLLTMNLC